MKLNKLIFFIVLLGLLRPLQASHTTSGDLFYRWSPIPTDSSRYEVYLILYTLYPGLSSPNSVNMCLSSSCFPDVNFTLNRVTPPAGLLSPYDPSPAWRVSDDYHCVDSTSTYYQMSGYHYSNYVSVPGICSDFKFSTVLHQRALSDNINSSVHVFLSCMLNNTLGENSSPEFNSSAAVNLCLNTNTTRPQYFSHSAISPDGDSLVYTLAHPEDISDFFNTCGPSVSATYNPGFSYLNPIPGSPPLQLNASNGFCSIKPAQQGSFYLKVEVEDWRFDPLIGVYVKVGTSIREVMTAVVAQCGQNSTGGIYLDQGTSFISGLNYYSSTQADSLINAYNLNQIARDSSQGALVPVLNALSCPAPEIELVFNKPILCSSINLSDFRLVAPDSTPIPVIGIIDSCSNSVSTKVRLQPIQPLNSDGNFLLQIKVGNDGNTLIDVCGNELLEFSSLIIPISGCSGVGLNEWPASWWVSNRVLRRTPAQASFTAHAPGFDGYFALRVFNQVGQQVYQDIQFPNQGKWDAQGLSTGVYIYQLESLGQGSSYLKRGRLMILD